MIFDSLRDTLARQFDIDPESITEDTNLVDDIGADSLDIVELVMTLEDTYNIHISDDDIASLTTVKAISDYLEKLQ